MLRGPVSTSTSTRHTGEAGVAPFASFTSDTALCVAGACWPATPTSGNGSEYHATWWCQRGIATLNLHPTRSGWLALVAA